LPPPISAAFGDSTIMPEIPGLMYQPPPQDGWMTQAT
jgi:hypothetical protein